MIACEADLRNQHELFVRDAIARSLLTLPFATLRPEPFTPLYGYYKTLLASAESGEMPESGAIDKLVDMIHMDAAMHDAVGNATKADIERRWCAGLLLHFTWGQGARS